MNSGLPSNADAQPSPATADEVPSRGAIPGLRSKRAAYSIAARYGTGFIAVLVNIISVRLCLIYFGKERYGLWLIVNSLLVYLTVADLGIGLGLQNLVAKARAKGAIEDVAELFNTTFMIALSLGVVFSSAMIVAVRYLHPERWFGATQVSAQRELHGTLIVLAASLVLILPAQIIANTQSAYQETYFNSLWSGVATLLAFCFLLLTMRLHGGLVLLMILTVLAVHVANGANWYLFRSRHSEVQLRISKLVRSRLPQVMTTGGVFFVLTIYTLVLWQTDNLVIARTLGAEQVVPYAMAFRLLWLPFSILVTIPMALWPGYTDAMTSGDWQWVAKSFHRTTSVTMVLAACWSTVLALWGADLVRLWSGGKVNVSPVLMLGLAVYLICLQWVSCNAVLVNASGKLRGQVWIGAAEAILNLTLSIVWAKKYGIAGVAWGTAVACILVPCWFQLRFLPGEMRNRLSHAFRDYLRPLAIPLVASSLCGAGLRFLLKADAQRGVATVAACIALQALIFGVVLLVTVPEMLGSLRSLEQQGRRLLSRS